MTRPNIIADNEIPFLRGVLEDHANVSYLPGSAISNELIKKTDALIIRTRTSCDEKLLAGTAVRYIATATVGYDHIDTGYCDRAGIVWTNAPGCNASSVEQYILSVLLALSELESANLNELTIGIVGVGHVGGRVKSISETLGMKVLLNDPPRARKEGADCFVDLYRIRQRADIISLHVPLNYKGPDKTFHLVDKEFFYGLERKPVLINTSRGEVVSTGALKTALLQQKLKAAVLDVWEGEPEVDTELLGLVDIATPHIAGYATDSKANGTRMSVRALSRYFGLGLDDWTPAGLPAPETEHAALDGRGKHLRETLREAVFLSYNVMNDDHALRSAPRRFEYLRANYPVRREPAAYSIRIVNDEAGAGRVLKKLGFRVLNG